MARTLTAGLAAAICLTIAACTPGASSWAPDTGTLSLLDARSRTPATCAYQVGSSFSSGATTRAQIEAACGQPCSQDDHGSSLDVWHVTSDGALQRLAYWEDCHIGEDTCYLRQVYNPIPFASGEQNVQASCQHLVSAGPGLARTSGDEAEPDCRLHSDCPQGQWCIDAECRVECREDRDCEAGSCEEGRCARQ